jgi:hypothetical protein
MHKRYRHPIEDLEFSLLRKLINAFYKANEGQTFIFCPENPDSVLEEHHQKCSPPMFPPPLAKCDAAGHQHPTHMKNWCRHSSLQPKHLYTITTLRSQLL